MEAANPFAQAHITPILPIIISLFAHSVLRIASNVPNLLIIALPAMSIFTFGTIRV